MGNLIDAMLSENNKVDYIKKTYDNIKVSSEDFLKAEKMKNAFLDNSFCLNIYKNLKKQVVSTNVLKLNKDRTGLV